MSDAQSPADEGTTSAPIRIFISHAPAVSAPTAPPRRFDSVIPVFELIAKYLPTLVVISALLIFKVEVSEFLKNASKVELFGFKLEKGEFDKRLQEAAKGKGDDSRRAGWMDVPFRKLKLAAPLLKGMKVLWVDDEPKNNFYLRKILSDVGVEITIAMNNAEALDAINRKDFELVISDFNRAAPLQETGGDLARTMMAIGYDAPVIFYTSNPANVPTGLGQLATNDPARFLGEVAETAIARSK